MAKEIVKRLHSANYHASQKMVDLCWVVETYYDGELVSSEKDYGAYPVDDSGKIIDLGKTANGISLSDVLGQAGATAQANLRSAQDYAAIQEHRAEQAEELASTLQSEKDALIAENENLKLALQRLGEETKAAWAERNDLHAAALNFESELNQAKSVLAIKDATIESLQAENKLIVASKNSD